MASSENPGLCITPFDKMFIYLCVSSAFVSVASLDSGVFGCRLMLIKNNITTTGVYFHFG